MAVTTKVTIAPVFGLASAINFDDRPFRPARLPFPVYLGITLEDVSEWIEHADFSLWADTHLSKHDIEEMRRWHDALVHRYEGEPYVQDEPDAGSLRLVRKVFTALRIVRPSSKEWSFLQARLIDNSRIEPFNFSRPERMLLVPDSEGLGVIREPDAVRLQQVAPGLIKAYDIVVTPIVRAVRNMEVGYLSPFPDVQQLLWVTGLDALFTGQEPEHRGALVAGERIKDFLGAEHLIYESGDVADGVVAPNVTVSDVVSDVYALRNCFAHGDWPTKEWTTKIFRQGLDKPVTYADMLREATSVLLRTSLDKILRDDGLIKLFSDKQHIKDHYASRGLVRGRILKSARQN